MTSPDSGKLRPCPFCGKNPHFNTLISLASCECTYGKRGVTLGISAYKETWNSAYCWREIDALREKVERLERAIHAARTLWCNSKRDPETGMLDIKYLDQFEAAISTPRPDGGEKQNLLKPDGRGE